VNERENTMHMKQLLADLQIVLTLGFLAGVAICGGVAIIGAIMGALRTAWRGKSGRKIAAGFGAAKWAFVAGCIVVAIYGAALVGASLASRDITLPPGQEKYFCELDCHLAYAVTDVTALKTIGQGVAVATAPGTSYVVTIRTRFDEKTASPDRGDAPLQPPPRRIVLVDADGRQYEPSAEGQSALAGSHQDGEDLTTPLRPGESYFTRLAFDLPPGAREPRVLLESPARPRWMGWIAAGDEENFFHKKVYLQLPATTQIAE
jgi:hypothetical protein